MKTILRIAEDNGVTSIAIPSLGVGKLHYPAHISAKIILKEITEFQARKPGTNIEFNLVVFDQDHYQEFSKQYAREIGSAQPQKRVIKLAMPLKNYNAVLPCRN